MTLLVSLHQPEFFPWAGFFNKVARVEKMVILDNVQFKKNYFENRCRIIIGGKASWLTVPVLHKGRHGQSIREVLINNSTGWGKKAWRTLSQSYSQAPYWADHAKFLETTLLGHWEHLADLNIHIIEYFCGYLGLPSDFRLGSDICGEAKGSDMVIAACQSLNATAYLSGQFGMDYLDEEDFRRAGIELRFQRFEPKPHPQFNGPGTELLSILDTTLNLGRDAASCVRGKN